MQIFDICIFAFLFLCPLFLSSLLEDGIFFLRKRKDFPNEVFLLEFESEKKVNEGKLRHSTDF